MKRFFVILLYSSVNSSLVADIDALHRVSQTNVVELTPAYVASLAEEARTNYPGLRAAGARVEAARFNEQSVRKWEDPMAKFGVAAAEREMREDNGDILFEIEQKLPLFGKVEAARNVAKSETSVAEAKVEADFQVLRKDIAKGVFTTALAERVVEIGRQDLQWLEATETVVAQRYEVGEASQVDLLRLQNERARRVTQIKTDENNLAHERVNLNKWLNRDLHSAWPSFRLPPVAESIPFSQALVDLALKYEPELKTHRAEIAVATRMIEQADKARRPDVSLGAEIRKYSATGEPREGMITLSLSLPWGNRGKYDADVRREEQKKKAEEYEAAKHVLTIRDEVYHLTVQIDAARREALLYRDEVLPRSEAALESARIVWEANRGMFRDVLEARRMLLDAQLMYARAVAEQYNMMSELVLCCGLGDLEALQMIGAIPGGESSEKK